MEGVVGRSVEGEDEEEMAREAEKGEMCGGAQQEERGAERSRWRRAKGEDEIRGGKWSGEAKPDP